jgi:hypothetical protein
MAGVEVSSSEFKRRLSNVQRAEVDQHLAAGRGVACYANDRGAAIVVMKPSSDSYPACTVVT